MKIHFGDIDGLNLCYVKRSFQTPLEVSQDSSQVTCEYCKQGSMGTAWRDKYGIAQKPKRGLHEEKSERSFGMKTKSVIFSKTNGHKKGTRQC
jgi:hypothetical protein